MEPIRQPVGSARGVPDLETGPPLVGSSLAFRGARDLAERVARRQSSIMILGETGSGKEVLARYVHARSARTAAPFVPVDCSCLSQGIFESELFGHVRGAFTGATRDSVGFVRAAHGGTLFLDEIGELGLPLQAKLLRVLQERQVTPVGASRPLPVDIRVVAATHRDLPEMVRQGTFRQDLYFRLNVVVLYVPPLRARPDDIIPLAEHFLRLQARIYDEPLKRLSPDAAEMLRAYDWPGNVRELSNIVEHAVVLSAAETIEAEDLPPALKQSARASGQTILPAGQTLREIERQVIMETLKRTRHCKAAASRLLGIDVRRLNRLITKCAVPLP